MGIYIPGIEMPKGHNYVTITIWSSGAASSVLFDREGVLRDFKDFKELKAIPVPEHKEIKAVPVPEHGRLGDLDAAVELAMQYCPDDDGSCSKAGSDLRELLDEIESLPTIIPADGMI